MSRLGFGIIGCGTAATALCRVIGTLTEARIVATFDVDHARARRVAAKYGASAHHSVDELLSDDRVDAVYVAVPHHLLAPMVEEALAARRHTLAEKPLALDAPTAARLGRLAARLDMRLGVCFELRESAAVRWAREAIDAGAIGDIRTVRIRTVIDKPADYWAAGAPPGSGHGWRTVREHAGGGVVLMNSIHQLDVVRFVTGCPFVRAAAEVATFTTGLEVEDTAAAALRLANGAVVSLTAAAHSPGARQEQEISIDGSHGRIDLPYLLGGRPPRIYLRNPWESWPVRRWTAVDTVRRDCHRESVRSFLDAVRRRSEPVPNARDAAAALHVVNAVYESARLGRAVDIDTGDCSGQQPTP